jgi:argininosuccinate lyase
MKGMFETTEFDNSRLLAVMKKSTILATDGADWLVLKGVPFREAHDIMGEVVKYCIKKGKGLEELSADELNKINPVFDETATEVFKLESSLSRKKTHGSPNPDFVKEEILSFRKRLQS